MLAIYNVRGTGAVSLEYLQCRTGFSRRRLWRAFEDLEDVGYVEVLDGDPRGPVVRWMDLRRSANARVFASTFLELPKQIVTARSSRRSWRSKIRHAAAKAPPRRGLALWGVDPG